ncbi:MAG: class I SAM-dependent methyltransferase [Candidatus Hydrogenedentota bacterium]
MLPITPVPRRATSERRVEGRRLAYYVTAADIDFWDHHWRTVLSRETYQAVEKGFLGSLEAPFLRHLPGTGRILEAGCGPGTVVVALRARGYDCEGIEWGKETVRAVRALQPNLPIRDGDVTRVDVPEGHYQAYISLGVMEHRREGPEPFLKEAHRILAPGGIMMISVPSFHVLRRLKARLGFYPSRGEELSFYQYAFSSAEMTEILGSAGFQVIEQFAYDSFKGIKDELPPVKWLSKMKSLNWRLPYWLGRSPWAERTFGHMMLFACRKTSG